MPTSLDTTVPPISAEAFAASPDAGRRNELVLGKVISLPPPGLVHGIVCGQVYFLLRTFLQARDLGTPVCNDSGVVTQRGPDTVRGADVAFYSYARLPRGERPAGYPAAAPDLVFEVLSPDDRWREVVRKVGEYLNADVTVVCVLDPARRMAHVYRADQPVEVAGAGHAICFAPALPAWTVAVDDIFAMM